MRKNLAATQASGPQLWRSLEELSQTPEFLQMVEREFPQAASEWADGVSRRRFLRLMSASLALGGLTACTRQPLERIVPYVQQPEQIIPGNPLFFATSMELDGFATGLLVETQMGRPIKVEGNPEHPASRGATDLFAQASVLDLFDPDRSQTVQRLGRISTWASFFEDTTRGLAALDALGGARLRLLTGTVTSPSLAAAIGR
ncbi:MAG: TAT-variant-translocated molybdopterin oxidoreductase, partial [Acidobacteriota bacterium]|nr:TAT-variant-translocated molybdopterin oxidoreductase [Acidobacteriota bacterium]